MRTRIEQARRQAMIKLGGIGSTRIRIRGAPTRRAKCWLGATVLRADWGRCPSHAGFGIVRDRSPRCMNSCFPPPYGPAKPSWRREAIRSRRLMGPKRGLSSRLPLPSGPGRSQVGLAGAVRCGTAANPPVCWPVPRGNLPANPLGRKRPESQGSRHRILASAQQLVMRPCQSRPQVFA